MGPMKTKSKYGVRYVLVFVDAYLRCIVTYFLNKKVKLPTSSNQRIKCLLSDNGTEFVNKSMDKIRQQYGFIHRKAILYSPLQNGVDERMNKTFMEKARRLLNSTGVSSMWWVCLINRSTNSMRSTTTPYELSFKTKPCLIHLRSNRTKLEAKRCKCIFLGYAEDSNGYRVYDLESNNVKIFRSVKLDEWGGVNDIYDTTSAEDSTSIYVTKDVVGSALSQRMEQPAADEPMDSEVKEAVEAVGIRVIARTGANDIPKSRETDGGWEYGSRAITP
ncbi:Rve-domain-containing hypothetical protein [Phytophthora megakarya]|uniref:Integrase catalytic domain-containing protein n=1 Tax=Phytophthora megakarya TaxID=4795 RepID=A0A225WH11_9STRA|nr:Rve-domain-containing hypothetical protein [Phytophthora megakarya]